MSVTGEAAGVLTDGRARWCGHTRAGRFILRGEVWVCVGGTDAIRLPEQEMPSPRFIAGSYVFYCYCDTMFEKQLLRWL